MARVFRGKIAIPGDQMEAYFEALGQFETAKAPLRTQLEQCARDFERALAQQYVAKTVRKHLAIIALFIDFVCWDTDVHRIEEITRGGSVSDLYFYWEVCHAEPITERKGPWYSFP